MYIPLKAHQIHNYDFVLPDYIAIPSSEESRSRKSEEGSLFVISADEAIQAIANDAGNVNEPVREIASKSQAQVHGIDQICTAISDMNNVIHRSTTTYEESTSDSEELNIQAEQVRDHVKKLRIMIVQNIVV